MANWLQIKVDKRNCEFISNKSNESDNFPGVRFPSKYKIIMPQDGEYAGYHIMHSESLCSERPNYCAVIFPTDYIFSLIRTEREPGQRFSRIKLNAEQFKAAFAAMDRRLDRKDGEMWLAEITDYEYDGQIEIGREKRYAVGELDGKWLYLNADDKRRISANGLKLIRKLNKKDVEKFEQMRKEHQSSLQSVENIKEYKNRFIRELIFHSFKGSERIAAAEENLCDIVNDELIIAENALLKQEEHFEKFVWKNTDKEKGK